MGHRQTPSPSQGLTGRAEDLSIEGVKQHTCNSFCYSCLKHKLSAGLQVAFPCGLPSVRKIYVLGWSPSVGECRGAEACSASQTNGMEIRGAETVHGRRGRDWRWCTPWLLITNHIKLPQQCPPAIDYSQLLSWAFFFVCLFLSPGLSLYELAFRKKTA